MSWQGLVERRGAEAPGTGDVVQHGPEWPSSIRRLPVEVVAAQASGTPDPGFARTSRPTGTPSVDLRRAERSEAA